MISQSMAWVGGSLLLCTSLRYAVLDPRTGACTHLFSLPADAPSPTLILPLQATKLAILLMVRPTALHAMPSSLLEPIKLIVRPIALHS